MGLGSLMQFWPFYLRQHAKRETRLLHYVGSTAALTVAGASLAAGKYKVLPLVLLAGGQATHGVPCRQMHCACMRQLLQRPLKSLDVPHPYMVELEAEHMFCATGTTSPAAVPQMAQRNTLAKSAKLSHLWHEFMW